MDQNTVRIQKAEKQKDAGKIGKFKANYKTSELLI